MNQLGLLDGRYRLLEELGRGAFGSVHRAAHLVLGEPVREVAVKLFYGNLITAANMREKMNDAFQLLAVLATLSEWQTRQHFLTIFDLGISREVPARAYIVMEYVQGGNLAKRISEQKRFTLAGCLHYLQQICRAMAFMHQCKPQFVHSDLKPENILLFQSAGNDQVKIGDFGLAGVYHGPLEAGPHGGTMSYFAPELFYEMTNLPASDVFSMGLIAYEMLTGANPYDEVGSTLDRSTPDYREVLRKLHQQARQTPLRLQRSDFLAAGQNGQQAASLASLIDVVNRMLECDLALRYDNAQEAYQDLERIAAGGFPQGPSEKSQPVGGPPPHAAQLPPLEIHTQQFKYALTLGDWTEASAAIQQIANSIGVASGQADLPYRLQAQLARAQAQAVSQPAFAGQFRKQAADALRRGLDRQLSDDERSRLESELADLRKELGIQ